MEPLKTYDDLTLARQRIFERIRPFGAEQYAREFPIGRGEGRFPVQPTFATTIFP